MITYLPESLTCAADDDDRAKGDQTLGKPLNRRMTRYLDDSLRGMSFRARMEQLADIYPEAHEAYSLRLRGETLAEIGTACGVSVATAHRLVAKAERYVELGMRGRDPETELSYERRLELLAAGDRRAYDVLVMARAGWRQAQIADQLTTSLSTVGRLYRRAIAYAGAEQPDVLDRILGPAWSRTMTSPQAEHYADNPLLPRLSKPVEKEAEKE